MQRMYISWRLQVRILHRPREAQLFFSEKLADYLNLSASLCLSLLELLHEQSRRIILKRGCHRNITIDMDRATHSRTANVSIRRFIKRNTCKNSFMQSIATPLPVSFFRTMRTSGKQSTSVCIDLPMQFLVAVAALHFICRVCCMRKVRSWPARYRPRALFVPPSECLKTYTSP